MISGLIKIWMWIWTVKIWLSFFANYIHGHKLNVWLSFSLDLLEYILIIGDYIDDYLSFILSWIASGLCLCSWIEICYLLYLCPFEVGLVGDSDSHFGIPLHFDFYSSHLLHHQFLIPSSSCYLIHLEHLPFTISNRLTSWHSSIHHPASSFSLAFWQVLTSFSWQ